jgi:hypothetical protein
LDQKQQQQRQGYVLRDVVAVSLHLAHVAGVSLRQRQQRERSQSPEANARSGIFQSGRSKCYGTQPKDNKHSFAVVLSEMEMQKKREQDKEMKK